MIVCGVEEAMLNGRTLPKGTILCFVGERPILVAPSGSLYGMGCGDELVMQNDLTDARHREVIRQAYSDGRLP